MSVRQSRQENYVNLCKVRCEVPSVVSMEKTVICDVTHCSVIDMYQRIEEQNASVFQSRSSLKIEAAFFSEAFTKLHVFAYHFHQSLECLKITPCDIYRLSQEERPIFWEVIVSAILSEKVYMYMCSIPKRFRDGAMDYIARINERQDALRRATRHVLTWVAKRIWCWRCNFRKCIILGKEQG
jgi:hypothetical protein